MKPIAEVTREGFIKKMFPYKMDFSFVEWWIDESLPLDQQVEEKREILLAKDLPCMVQCATTADYEREYIVLSPCLNLNPGDEVPNGATLTVYMNGKKNTATMREILAIDNLEVYETNGLKIGCKIRVGTGAKWTW
jgi:hypothetical protein